jgi:hypothetical protein
MDGFLMVGTSYLANLTDSTEKLLGIFCLLVGIVGFLSDVPLILEALI